MTPDIRTSEIRTDTKDLLTLAERMGIPADEAIRLAQLIAEVDRPDAERPELETPCPA